MPYSHFHDWSFHTHHRRPKGGNHYRAVRRRQRPFWIAFWLVLVGGLVAIGVVTATRYDVLPKATAVIDTSVGEFQATRQERTATRTAQAEIDRQTRVADAAAREERTATRTVQTEIDRQTRVADAVAQQERTATRTAQTEFDRQTKVADAVAREERTATRTAQTEIDRQTRVADAQERTATRTAQEEIDRQTRVADAAAREETTITQLEMKIHEGINAERINYGGSALRWDDELAALARAHSDDMTRRGYFSHDTPEGLDPTDRLHRAGLSCRKGFHYGIAENLAIETALGNLERTAAEAVSGWMNSSGHRRNLLNGRYGTTGIGASFGNWQGYKAVYLTQVFC